ncbi:MAG: 16S rRNA (guanine(527)-N(7))-methyltransferase RsmG [Rubellimicrobium sp.]|nr:16S rRNA (guanine(527)-N(7))-methyltransferase RsmG [Rubellimicrobium sp.]
MSRLCEVAGHNVSRETEQRLRRLVELVEKWTQRINLISPASRPAIWDRHVLDSAQLYPLAPRGWQHWADLGSGGGFPGLIVATLAFADRPDTQVTLVESDQRKAAFLRSAASTLGLQVQVLASRIEGLPPLGADVVSARALAPLPALLGYCARHLAPGGIALLPKGQRADEEIAAARKLWHFDLTLHPGLIDPAARLIQIESLRRA